MFCVAFQRFFQGLSLCWQWNKAKKSFDLTLQSSEYLRSSSNVHGHFFSYEESNLFISFCFLNLLSKYFHFKTVFLGTQARK